MPTPSNAIEINDGSHKSGRSTRRSGSRSAHDDGLDSFSKGDSGAGASAGSSNSRFRHRKISVKQHLKIYLPNDLKHLDKDELQQREVVEIETGVEKNEEKEVHLHRILQMGSGHTKHKDYIPTPDASMTWNEYDKFYTGSFQETTSYIKFSATVEDCCGTNYNMDERDETFLNEQVNKGSSDILTEDEFEILCSSFEHAIHERQPFLSMDPESILSFEELKPTLIKSDMADFNLRNQLNHEINSHKTHFITQFDPVSQMNTRPLIQLIEKFGSKIYDYWRERKIEVNGYEIFPQLKFERPGEKEEIDPYVCFRRREVRHPRKTRRIDILNSQRLRALHQELKNAKDLALLVAKRENVSLNWINDELKIFDQRVKIKNLKRSLNISGEDDDLINHKRKRPTIVTVEQREAELRKAELKRAAAAAAAAKAKNNKRNNQLEDKSSRLIKQQQQQLLQQQQQQQQNALKTENGKQLANASSSSTSQPITSHVYVKLPSSKIPDIVLEDVDALLNSKEKNARKFVQEKMEKRKIEDADVFFNLTDDPFNPVFDMSLPKNFSTSNVPFASIASSKFQIDRSFYSSHLPEYLKGISDDIRIYDSNGRSRNKDNYNLDTKRIKKTELYDPFRENLEIHSREYPIKFRKRVGRSNIKYVDRMPNFTTSSTKSACSLMDFVDFDSIEKEQYSREGSNDTDSINVYDSKYDEFVRLYDKWKYDSPQNEYGIKFSDEPARLNQISNDTQVIRFGTMLGTKSYEQLREATIKYRRDYITRLKQKHIQHLQQQQQQQQAQQQKQKSQNNNSNSSNSLKKLNDSLINSEAKQNSSITQKNSS